MSGVRISRLLSACVILGALVSHLVLADSTPLQNQIEQAGTPVYTGLAKANHVFGYKFRVLESGEIDQVGGYFSGTKRVVIVNDTNDIVSNTSVAGNGAGFVWATLSSPVQVEAGQEFSVLVRSGSDTSSAAVWSVAMPFSNNGIQVLSLQQGWSASTNPATWAASAQTLPDLQARGLVDVRFTVQPAPAQLISTNPSQDSVPPMSPVAGDPYPSTPGVVDSFGQSAPSGPLGMGFMAVKDYYQKFPRRAGECSREIHDRYWVRDQNGVTHPTWHPPVDAATGCLFAHEHGDNPTLSPNYAFAQGVPFGLTHGKNDALMRHEDHVGHKVVVQNNWALVDGNPQNGELPDSDVIRRTGISCNWLSKIHQGSWSRDALANNAHEYFLNLRCTDGVQLRLKQLITFGPPELVTNICEGPEINPIQALSVPDRTSEAFPTGIAANSGTPVINALDGKREFACLKNMRWKEHLEELWKSDGVIKFPGGGFINFSPYYVVSNPARYIDHRWAIRGATDGYISTIDLCFDDNAIFRGMPMKLCEKVPTALGNLSSVSRQRDIRNPMNGTRRVIHPKSVIVYTQNEAGNDQLITFCTDTLGRNSRLPEDGVCMANEIEQLVSRSDRRQWNWNGSDVNSIEVSGRLRGAGYLNEWVRNFSAPGIRFPN